MVVVVRSSSPFFPGWPLAHAPGDTAMRAKRARRSRSASRPPDPYSGRSAFRQLRRPPRARAQVQSIRKNRCALGRSPVRMATVARWVGQHAQRSVRARQTAADNSPTATAHSASARGRLCRRGIKGPTFGRARADRRRTATRNHSIAGPGRRHPCCGAKSLRMRPWWYSSKPTAAPPAHEPRRSTAIRPCLTSRGSHCTAEGIRRERQDSGP